MVLLSLHLIGGDAIEINTLNKELTRNRITMTNANNKLQRNHCNQLYDSRLSLFLDQHTGCYSPEFIFNFAQTIPSHFWKNKLKFDDIFENHNDSSTLS